MRRSRAEITLLELALFTSTDALDDQLRPLVVQFDCAPHLHDVVAVKKCGNFLGLVPGLSLDLPCAVPEQQVEIPPARALRSDFFLFDESQKSHESRAGERINVTALFGHILPHDFEGGPADCIGQGILANQHSRSEQ